MKLANFKKLLILHVTQILISCCLLLLFVPYVANAKIAYNAYGSIYVMNDDGSGRRRLTDNQFWELRPRWSPDGTRIAFDRNLEKDTQKYQLFIMNADGTNQQQLTHSVEGDINGASAWSPDGRYLAFKSNRSGHREIYVMDLESREVKQLTDAKGKKGSGSYSPDWSPNGEEIVYGKFVPSGKGISHKTVWIMSTDGQNQRPFVPDPDGEDGFVFRFYPRWSTDGKQILFIESIGQWEHPVNRFVILSKTGRKKEIDIDEKIGGEWAGGGLSWMDNGRTILFSAKRTDVPEKDPDHDIYKYEIATRRLRRLTREPSFDYYPDWIEGPLPVSPQGKLPMQWGNIKALYGVETSIENEKYASP